MMHVGQYGEEMVFGNLCLGSCGIIIFLLISSGSLLIRNRISGVV